MPSRIVVNTELSGVQLRNLQAAWGIPVLDRIGLIIEIFAQRARTREAKLQVRLPVLTMKEADTPNKQSASSENDFKLEPSCNQH